MSSDENRPKCGQQAKMAADPGGSGAQKTVDPGGSGLIWQWAQMVAPHASTHASCEIVKFQ